MLREHRMGKPGHVAFREGFLEEVMSKMVPDRGTRVGQGKKGGKDLPGSNTQVRKCGHCKELRAGAKGCRSRGWRERRGIKRGSRGLCSVGGLFTPEEQLPY